MTHITLPLKNRQPQAIRISEISFVEPNEHSVKESVVWLKTGGHHFVKLPLNETEARIEAARRNR